MGVPLTGSACPALRYLLSAHHHGRSLLLPRRSTSLPCILALETPALSLRRSYWPFGAFVKCHLPLSASERLKNSGTLCLSYIRALQKERAGRKGFLLPELFMRSWANAQSFPSLLPLALPCKVTAHGFYRAQTLGEQGM